MVQLRGCPALWTIGVYKENVSLGQILSHCLSYMHMTSISCNKRLKSIPPNQEFLGALKKKAFGNTIRKGTVLVTSTFHMLRNIL